MYGKTIYTKLKKTATRFRKSSITFWVKTVLPLKSKQKPRIATHSLDITDLEITSILLSLKCFYYQVNLKIINFLKYG